MSVRLPKMFFRYGKEYLNLLSCNRIVDDGYSIIISWKDEKNKFQIKKESSEYKRIKNFLSDHTINDTVIKK